MDFVKISKNLVFIYRSIFNCIDTRDKPLQLADRYYTRMFDDHCSTISTNRFDIYINALAFLAYIYLCRLTKKKKQF